MHGLLPPKLHQTRLGDGPAGDRKTRARLLLLHALYALGAEPAGTLRAAPRNGALAVLDGEGGQVGTEGAPRVQLCTSQAGRLKRAS